MDALRAANLGLRFSLELAMLAAVSWWGWHVEGPAAAAALPVAFALVWGSFLSPKARVAVPRQARLGLELILFAAAAAAFHGAGHDRLAIAFALAVVTHEALLAATHRRP